MPSPDTEHDGGINPKAQQLDLYVRSPKTKSQNHPDREIFDRFFAMNITWC